LDWANGLWFNVFSLVRNFLLAGSQAAQEGPRTVHINSQHGGTAATAGLGGMSKEYFFI
jgi:hypothetical protein